MDTVKRGDLFEKRSFEIIKKALTEKRLGLHSTQQFQNGVVGSFVNHLPNAAAEAVPGVGIMIRQFNTMKTGFTIGMGNSTGIRSLTNWGRLSTCLF